MYGNNSIYNSLKKIKYLGVNLTKDVNEFYIENYKLMKKKIEEEQKMVRSPMLMDW
jgi:hypothetical protein